MPIFDCTVLGDIFLDIIAYAAKDPIYVRGGTAYCNMAKVTFGGSGNVAAGLSEIGGKAAFVGKAGNDFWGELYRQNLEKKGVATNIFLDKELPTGLVLVFVDDRKERSFLVFRGANDKLSIRDVEKMTETIKRSKYVYFSGYSLVNEPQQSAILRGIEIARKCNTKIVFDPGAHNLIRSEPQLFAKLLNLCDVFSPNLDEALAVMGVMSVDEMINKLRGKVPLTALKCSENGCILINEKNILKIPSFKARCLDPTGAGDAFTAALIYGLAHNFPLEVTGQLANWFAAMVTTRLGSRSFPTKVKIDCFLKRLTEKPCA